MKFKRKSILSLALAGILFVSIPAEAATLSFNLGSCIEWAQYSVSALLSSKSFRKFAPAVAVAGIAVLGGILWYRSKNKDVSKQNLNEELHQELSELIDGGSDSLSEFSGREENEEEIKEKEEVANIERAQGTGLAEDLKKAGEMSEEEIALFESKL